MSSLNDLFAQNLFGTANTNTISQIPPSLRTTISNTISTVPYYVPYTAPETMAYYPLYPCPHKDLFHIAKQIDALPNIECKYQYLSQTFNIINTEQDKVIGRLDKDTKANQIVLQSYGCNKRFVRLITLELDCDLLAVINDNGDITGLYRVNSVG